MRPISTFLITFCLGLLFTASAEAAGFNCAKAASADEKIVCGDTQLSHLDDVFNARYGAARKTAPDEDDVVHSARNFLADRVIAVTTGPVSSAPISPFSGRYHRTRAASCRASPRSR